MTLSPIDCRTKQRHAELLDTKLWTMYSNVPFKLSRPIIVCTAYTVGLSLIRFREIVRRIFECRNTFPAAPTLTPLKETPRNFGGQTPVHAEERLSPQLHSASFEPVLSLSLWHCLQLALSETTVYSIVVCVPSGIKTQESQASVIGPKLNSQRYSHGQERLS